MFIALQVLTLFLVATAMAMSLAHALEFPGKLRLDRKTYYAMQEVYYPGFTIGGAFGEFGGMAATATLLLLSPSGTKASWLIGAALLGLIGMQIIYWVITHPVNKFWLENQNLGGLGAGFFSMGRKSERAADWTVMRNRWEYSHIARATLASLSFIALLIAVISDVGV